MTPSRKSKKPPPAPHSRGLSPAEVAGQEPAARLAPLTAGIAADGGRVLGSYRDPLGGHWQVLAALPIESVSPTPYQRDLSPAHVARLADAIGRLDRFMDPIVVVRTDGGYWTPNGSHRLAAMRSLGARSIVGIVVPERELAHRILALNTEKAHNVRERALEVIRLALALAELDDRPECDYSLEFEEPSLLTLGLCYLESGRFSGGAYHPILSRVESFSKARLSSSLTERRRRAARLAEIDAAVIEATRRLKERGVVSPYLKAFVIARINPLRFTRRPKADVDDTLERMLAAARRFDPTKVKADQVAAASGPPDE